MASALRCPPTRVFDLDAIKAIINDAGPQIIDAIAQGFVKYAEGRVKVGEVVHLGFPGDVPTKGGGQMCIKSGFVKDDDYVVVKMACGGAPGNAKLGIPLNTGAMLVFSARTMMLEAILLDESELTELRTAACGAVAARLLAPRHVTCIGVLGAGIQARYQIEMLRHVTACRKVLVWGRTTEKLKAIQRDLEASSAGWQVSVTTDVKEVTAQCNLIVTTTTANEALIRVGEVRPGTHLTCIGADGSGKQEVDPALVAAADLLAADSAAQCTAFGEVSHAVKAGLIPASKVMELGAVVVDPSLHRRADDDRITIVDSTGVAIQDIEIASLVYKHAKASRPSPIGSKL